MFHALLYPCISFYFEHIFSLALPNIIALISISFREFIEIFMEFGMVYIFWPVTFFPSSYFLTSFIFVAFGNAVKSQTIYVMAIVLLFLILSIFFTGKIIKFYSIFIVGWNSCVQFGCALSIFFILLEGKYSCWKYSFFFFKLLNLWHDDGVVQNNPVCADKTRKKW